MTHEIRSMNRLRCPLAEDFKELFFSLVDYRNSRFTGENPDKVIDFYDSFENRDDLIEWMKERPKGVANIYEVDGDKEIIVVIITADFHGKYAKECRENIFKGLHIIFVESGGRGDFYFNSAKNINVGVKKAMEYNPKWIVVSGDDMLKVDPINKLISSLSEIDNSKVDTVFTFPASYHSAPMILCRPNLLFETAIKIFRFFSPRVYYAEKAFSQMRRFNNHILFPRYQDSPSILYKLMNFIFFNKYKNFVNILSFGIFSSDFVRRCGELYDETYINEMEDTDLSVRLFNTGRIATTDFTIKERVGATLGHGKSRTLRTVPGWVYFSYKMERGDL